MTDCTDHDLKQIPTGQLCWICGKFWHSEGNKPVSSFRTPEKPTSLPVREADLVQGIYEGLRYRGRVVLRCGQHRVDKAGSDAGLPDILCWCPQRRGWIGIETKTPSGRLSPAQKALENIGAIYVCRSIEDAFKAVGERL